MREKHNPNSPGYTNALLESLEDKFRVIIEATQPIPRMAEKLEATFEEVGKLRQDVDLLKSALTDLRTRLQVIEQALKLINKNVSEIDDLKGRVQAIENAIRAR